MNLRVKGIRYVSKLYVGVVKEPNEKRKLDSKQIVRRNRICDCVNIIILLVNRLI
jgi:hypothetical protein